MRNYKLIADFTMMKKNNLILDFLQRNKELIDTKKWAITDYWDADSCAIGFTKDERLIYISNYNYLDCHPLKFDYQIEEGGITVKQKQAVSESELMKEFS